MMIAVLVTLVSLRHFAAGEDRLTCQSQIQAAVGDDVALQCQLEANTNLSSKTVAVKTNGLVVHTYRHGQDNLDDQTDQFRGRTRLVHEDLSQEVVTLIINSVNESDSGTYKVYIPKLRVSGDINLTVTSDRTKTFYSSTSSPAVDGHEVAAKTNPVWIAVLVVAVVVVAAAAVFYILVKKGVIRKCKGAEATTTRNDWNANFEKINALY